MIREIQAKTLLSSSTEPDPWFGIKYTMNLYRGCQHRCIYCDSRSQCYGIEDFDGEVLVKANALDLLRRELPRKRVKGYISTGSMNDAYMPLEREFYLTRRSLEIIAEFRFPVHILTKSDLILRDLDVLETVNARASRGEGGVWAASVEGQAPSRDESCLSQSEAVGGRSGLRNGAAGAAGRPEGQAPGVERGLPQGEEGPPGAESCLSQSEAVGGRSGLRNGAAGAAGRPEEQAAGRAGAVVSFTVTTVDDDLARKLEPSAPSPSRRLAALAEFARRGIRTGVMLMPVLPFIEDNLENIAAVVSAAAECGASYVVPGFGVTLRDRQRRAHYYAELDRLFPGLSDRYRRAFGERYHAAAQGTARLEAAFEELRLRLGLERCVAPYGGPPAAQLSLF